MCPVKIEVLKNFAKFTGKSVVVFFEATFYRTPPVAASENTRLMNVSRNETPRQNEISRLRGKQ